MSETKSIKQISSKRWVDVASMAIFGGLAVAGLFYFKKWTGLDVSLMVGFGLILFIWMSVSILSGWSLSLKQVLAYPPTPFAVIAGYGIYLGLILGSWLAGLFGLVVQTIGWLLGKLIVAVYQKIFKKKKLPSSSEKSASPAEHWFLDERPVIDPSLDRFKIRGVEKQIVKLIHAGKNVAVLGKYGSGKSTVIKWAEKELQERPENEFITCTLGAWGRRREGFSSHLLHMATVSLKPHLDTLSFIDIPLQYHSALASHGFFGELFASALSSRDPADILTRLDEALRATEKKLLFVIEDVDRNRDKALLMEELPALLDRINGTSNIQFVLAVDAESADSAWFLRVASCVDIPIIESLQALRMIEDFRKLIFDGSWIDPISVKQREKWFSSNNTDPFGLAQQSLDAAYTTQLALVNILANPREFKAVLRETWEKWTVLKGEVDPDDLLVLTVIKITTPALYQLLLSKRERFVEIAEETGRREGRAKEKEVFIKEAKGMMASQEIFWSPSVDAAVNHLFLHWKLGPVCPLKEKPQSIAIRSGFDAATDYWSRVQRVQIIEPVCDQEVLRLLQQAVGDPSACDDLAEKIYTNDLWASKVRQFGIFVLNEEASRQFLDAYFRLLISDLNVDRHKWEVPGWHEALSLAPSRWSKDFDGRKWWYGHIIHALEYSAGLAYKMVMTASKDEYYGIKISRLFYRALKTCWTDHPEKIICSLSQDHPMAFFGLVSRSNDCSSNEYPSAIRPRELDGDKEPNVFLCDSVDRHRTLIRPEDWIWLTPSLFEAIEINSRLLLPILAFCVTRSTEFFGNKFVFFEEVAENWFGSRTDELAQWLLETDVDWPTGRVADRFLVAKEWAQKRLAQKGK